MIKTTPILRTGSCPPVTVEGGRGPYTRPNDRHSLYPMLENGLITFELLWALWKPNTLAFTTTYGSPDEPRVFKVEMAEKHHGIMKGEYYYIEGKVWDSVLICDNNATC